MKYGRVCRILVICLKEHTSGITQYNQDKKYRESHIRSGKDVYVEYDEPTALQIDGETVRNVKSYRVKA